MMEHAMRWYVRDNVRFGPKAALPSRSKISDLRPQHRRQRSIVGHAQPEWSCSQYMLIAEAVRKTQ